MKEFGIDNLETKQDFNINSRILEQASDTAEKLTTLECKLNGITEFKYVPVVDDDIEVEEYTEEAQDIFNIHYDEQVDELYNLLNAQLKLLDCDF